VTIDVSASPATFQSRVWSLVLPDSSSQVLRATDSFNSYIQAYTTSPLTFNITSQECNPQMTTPCLPHWGSVARFPDVKRHQVIWQFCFCPLAEGSYWCLFFIMLICSDSSIVNDSINFDWLLTPLVFLPSRERCSFFLLVYWHHFRENITVVKLTVMEISYEYIYYRSRNNSPKHLLQKYESLMSPKLNTAIHKKIVIPSTLVTKIQSEPLIIISSEIILKLK